MPRLDFQAAKEQIRQAVDIVDLVNGYLPLRRQGRGYVALCPWHDDSRPSLQVNPERQSFKCWVCDIGGDIFSFLMRIEGLEFREALEMLAERAGVTLQATRPAGEGDERFDRKNLYRSVAWAEQQFHHCLLSSPEAQPARDYLADRAITQQSIEQFHLGFAPPSWDWLLRQAAQSELSPEVLERVGLVARKQEDGSYYDRFRGRLMFSIRDVRSRPIAFGGRVLPGLARERDAKYVNSPETPLFSKSSQLYALDLAREGIAREQGIVVMEGYTDVIMAHQHGFTQSVAVLGTALTDRHVPLVRRFTDSITLVLDGDEAGQRRTLQILDELLALFVSFEIDLRILGLPEGADPCDVIASQGSEAFRQLLAKSVDAIEYKIHAVTNGLEIAPGTHRSAQAVEEILGTLARALPRQAGAASTTLVRQQQVLGRLSREFGVDTGSLQTRLDALRRLNKTQTRTSSQPAGAETPRERTTVSAWERELLELLIHCPQLVPTLVEKIEPTDIPSPLCRLLYASTVEAFRSGTSPTFDTLLLATDDAETKNLLVDCDERGREKLGSDADQRLLDLLADLDQRKQAARHDSKVAQLKQNQLDPDQEEETLAELYKDLKRSQTGPAPTDG